MIVNLPLSIYPVRTVHLLRYFEKTAPGELQLLHSITLSLLLTVALGMTVLLIDIQPAQAEQGVRQGDLSFSSSWTNRDPHWPVAVGDVQIDVGSCDGHAAGLRLGIAAPTPPQPYDLPPEAYTDCVDVTDVSAGDQPSCVIVHNATQLQEHSGLIEGLQSGPEQGRLIILEDGAYHAEDLVPPLASFPEQRFLRLSAGHRLWARNLGKAVLHFGIDLGGNGARFVGPELHGLVFDLQDAQHGAINVKSEDAPTIAVSIWGDARDAVIEDVQLYGHKQIERSIEAAHQSAADGLQIRRILVDGFSRYGILVQYCDKDDQDDLQCNGHSVAILTVVEDVVVRNVGGFFDPTDIEESAHVGIVMGAAGRLSRARVRDVTRAGITTQGTMHGGVLEDLDVDRIGLGTHFVWGRALYMENTTRETAFRRFCVGSSVQIGLVSEWDHCSADFPEDQCFSRGIDNTVSNGLMRSYFIGINFDQGTTRGYIENVTFRNAAHVGIVLHNNLDSKQVNNTFELPMGSCPVTTKHWNTENPCGFMTWQ